MDYEEAVLQERHAQDEVRRLAHELAEAAVPIAHFGDGNGGEVLRVIYEALYGAGIYSPEPERTGEVTGRRRKPIPNRVRTLVYERDAYRCVTCGTHEALTLDHLVPHSQGGSDAPDNLRTLCHSCNSSRGTRPL